MCVIIHKPAGLMFDEKKLETAALRNPDGYGFAIFDRGRIEIIKHFAPKGNDPDEVIEKMNDIKDLECFLHLRIKTVGDKNTDNCHPFPITTTLDGTGYYLMHNGTMSDFDKKDGRTDSYHYGQDIVRPLLEMWDKDSADFFDDDFVQRVLLKFAGYTSKVVIFNSKGEHFIVNKKEGTMIDGAFWASNDYSFRDYKKDNYYNWNDNSNTYRTAGTSNASGGKSVVPFRNAGNNNGTSATQTGTSNQSARTTTPSAEAPSTNARVINVVPGEEIVPVLRPSFCEVTGLQDLEEVCNLGATDIAEMVRMYPNHAVLLICELIEELYEEKTYGLDEWAAEAEDEEVLPHVG